MGQIASEVLIERLADWGVDTVFGLSRGRQAMHLAELLATRRDGRAIAGRARKHALAS